jgi:hypothetical protein
MDPIPIERAIQLYKALQLGPDKKADVYVARWLKHQRTNYNGSEKPAFMSLGLYAIINLYNMFDTIANAIVEREMQPNPPGPFVEKDTLKQLRSAWAQTLESMAQTAQELLEIKCVTDPISEHTFQLFGYFRVKAFKMGVYTYKQACWPSDNPDDIISNPKTAELLALRAHEYPDFFREMIQTDAGQRNLGYQIMTERKKFVNAIVVANTSGKLPTLTTLSLGSIILRAPQKKHRWYKWCSDLELLNTIFVFTLRTDGACRTALMDMCANNNYDHRIKLKNAILQASTKSLLVELVASKILTLEIKGTTQITVTMASKAGKTPIKTSFRMTTVI